MDLQPFYSSLLGPLYWLFLVMVIVAVLKSPVVKGWFGEQWIKLMIGVFLPQSKYRALHNVTIPTLDGATQIDHIVVSEFGIFVIETKNMKGWIFGSEHQASWTQKIYKKNFKFQNPLRQNYKHTKALQSALDLPSEAFKSVVVFVGDSSFKTPMPTNVVRGGGSVVSYIKMHQRPRLSAQQVSRAVSMIEMGRLSPNFETHRQHVSRLKSRSDTDSDQRCPRCGSQMILRTAKRGANAGRQFWGCSKFPKCRAVINID